MQYFQREWLSWWVIAACIPGMWLPGWVLPGWVLPAVLGAVAVTEYVKSLRRARSELPERVASHFGFSLEADGWMSRKGYLRTVTTLGLLVGAGVPLVFFGCVWQAGEVKMQRLAMWLLPMTTSLMWAMHELTVEANRREPAKMSPRMWWLIGLYLVAINTWALAVAVIAG